MGLVVAITAIDMLDAPVARERFDIGFESERRTKLVLKP
jgi:hypothetical protein